jgi:hypothetical protein
VKEKLEAAVADSRDWSPGDLARIASRFCNTLLGSELELQDGLARRVQEPSDVDLGLGYEAANQIAIFVSPNKDIYDVIRE